MCTEDKSLSSSLVLGMAFCHPASQEITIRWRHSGAPSPRQLTLSPTVQRDAGRLTTLPPGSGVTDPSSWHLGTLPTPGPPLPQRLCCSLGEGSQEQGQSSVRESRTRCLFLGHLALLPSTLEFLPIRWDLRA